jgi:altronate dehydratase
MDELLERFIACVLDIVGGQPTCAEQAHIHDMAIWKNGVTL